MSSFVQKNPASASESFLVAQSNKGSFFKPKIGKKCRLSKKRTPLISGQNSLHRRCPLIRELTVAIIWIPSQRFVYLLKSEYCMMGQGKLVSNASCLNEEKVDKERWDEFGEYWWTYLFSIFTLFPICGMSIWEPSHTNIIWRHLAHIFFFYTFIVIETQRNIKVDKNITAKVEILVRRRLRKVAIEKNVNQARIKPLSDTFANWLFSRNKLVWYLKEFLKKVWKTAMES